MVEVKTYPGFFCGEMRNLYPIISTTSTTKLTRYLLRLIFFHMHKCAMSVSLEYLIVRMRFLRIKYWPSNLYWKSLPSL